MRVAKLVILAIIVTVMAVAAGCGKQATPTPSAPGFEQVTPTGVVTPAKFAAGDRVVYSGAAFETPPQGVVAAVGWRPSLAALGNGWVYQLDTGLVVQEEYLKTNPVVTPTASP